MEKLRMSERGVSVMLLPLREIKEKVSRFLHARPNLAHFFRTNA
jgi:hypothetical protein